MNLAPTGGYFVGQIFTTSAVTPADRTSMPRTYPASASKPRPVSTAA